jgi:hypothetical protein
MLSGAFAGISLPGAIACEVFAVLEKPLNPFDFLDTVAAALGCPRQPILRAA